jgi:catechol 2,3-dioxygenase-like lactoylglutathione lyase family enzyme
VLRDYEVCAYAPVSNIERGRQFYEDVLELRPMKSNEGGVLYECASGSKFFMYLSGGAGTSKASTLFWSVTDIEKEVAELSGRGVVFERYDMPGMQMTGDIATAGGAKAAWFKDPDGNILALIQEIQG